MFFGYLRAFCDETFYETKFNIRRILRAAIHPAVTNGKSFKRYFEVRIEDGSGYVLGGYSGSFRTSGQDEPI